MINSEKNSNYKLDEKIIEKVKYYFDRCREVADYITDNPETGGNEEKAVKRITRVLAEEGYEIIAPCCGVKHSFLAVKRSRVHDNCKRAVIMCEYDALPEIGHACGHSISGAASLLAALAINSAYPDLPIRVDIMGTPSEEYPGGKVFLSDEGAFNGYEFAAMAHMFDVNSPTFKVLACTDRYITFHGKSSHASGNPCDGLNALNAARIFMDAMDMWRQHLPATSQIHGVVEKGGELPSIVPDKVILNYYFRAKNTHDLNDLIEKANKCVEGAALCTGTTYELVQRYPTYGDLYPNPLATNTVQEIFDAMGEKTVVFENPQGSTDAGNVDQLIPTFHPLVSVSNGKHVPLHDAAFAGLMKEESGYRGLYNGGLLIASLVHRLATNPHLLKSIQRQHREYRGIPGMAAE
jgi:amidohydrolase